MACRSQADSCSTMAQMSAGSSECCAAVVRASAMSVALSAGGAAVSELGGKAEECVGLCTAGRWPAFLNLGGCANGEDEKERQMRRRDAGGTKSERRLLIAAVV